MNEIADALTDEPQGHQQPGGIGVLLAVWVIASMLLWLLAFAEPPSGSGEWLRRTQLACFGSDESGLPSPAGWLILTLGPIMFIMALGLALPRECSETLRWVRRAALGRWFVGVLSVCVAVEGVWVAQRIIERLPSTTGSLVSVDKELPSGYPITDSEAPDFRLRDQNGGTVKLSDFRGRPVLLSFVFAHCQAVCPSLVRSVQEARRATEAENPVVLLMTLDPWRDTPAALPSLAAKWGLGSNEILLSGSPQDVNAALDAYGVPRERDARSGEVVHPALVKIINSKGRVAYTFNGASSRWLRDALLRIN